jgi:hypothetical protein
MVLEVWIGVVLEKVIWGSPLPYMVTRIRNGFGTGVGVVLELEMELSWN